MHAQVSQSNNNTKRGMLLSNFLTKAVVTTTISPRNMTKSSKGTNQDLQFSESLTDKEIMDRLGVVDDQNKG